MQLLIDAGNTQIKWAAADTELAWSGAPNWRQHGSVSHADIETLQSIWAALPITQILISNVAGETIQHSLNSLLSTAVPGLKPQRFVSMPECAGVKNGYAHPPQLGCDRFASAIGAHALMPAKTLLVVTCGTATTIDAVTSEGLFVGGMILPGLKLMAQSLARNTAQLPQIAESLSLQHTFADNTDQAIASGCISAQVGAIARAYDALANMQQRPVSCIISGGAAKFLLPHLELDYLNVENLVLTGLTVVAKSWQTQH
jgi:type III pantothenate kinase